jgi:hypothetical protein
MILIYKLKKLSMKKANLLIVFLFLCIFANAQKTIFINEGFSAMPPSGWTIDASGSHWTANASANAGGTSPEAQFDWSPQVVGVTHLISPAINTTGLSNVYLSFNHAFSGIYGNFTIGIATRNSPSGTWNTVWSIVNPTAGVSATAMSQIISNSDVGSATFQISFFFDGDSYNIDDWWIDDVMLYTPYNVDAKMNTISTPSYNGPGNVNITGTVKNMGTNTINALTVNYKIGAGAPQATTLTGLSVASGGLYNYTLTPAWTPTAGDYSVKSYVSSVNGLGVDSCVTNDTLTKAVAIATQTTTRLPLYEEFTSSTCAPCASFNGSTFTPFIAAHGTEFSLIKYQMNWPGNGDPYYTTEGGTRRTYYAVSGVPDLFIDGGNSTMSSSGMASELAAEAAKSTFFAITTTPTAVGNAITIPVTITPYVNGSFKVYVVIVEKTTTGNVSTNGETSFTHVMMKMMPNGGGNVVNFTAGTNYTNTFTYTKGSGDHIEQMSDLHVVVFVQLASTKEIFQSKNADIVWTAGIENNAFAKLMIYPNPATDNVNIINAENATVQLYDVFGKLIATDNILNNNYSLNVAEYAKGSYILKLTNSEGTISKKITVLK